MPLNLGDVEIIIDPPASGTPTLIVSGPRGPKGDKGDTGDAGSGGGLPDQMPGAWLTITAEELAAGVVPYEGSEFTGNLVLGTDDNDVPCLKAGPDVGNYIDAYINIGDRLDTRNKTYELAVLMTWQASDWQRNPSLWAYSQIDGDLANAYNESNWWTIGGKSIALQGFMDLSLPDHYWGPSLLLVGQGIGQWPDLMTSNPPEPNLMIEIWNNPVDLRIYAIKYRETNIIAKTSTDGAMQLGEGTTIDGHLVLTAPPVNSNNSHLWPAIPYLSTGNAFGYEVRVVPDPVDDSMDKVLRFDANTKNIRWGTEGGGGGGGAVSSVDGRTGAVNLDDLYVQSVDGRTGNVSLADLYTSPVQSVAGRTGDVHLDDLYAPIGTTGDQVGAPAPFLALYNFGGTAAFSQTNDHVLVSDLSAYSGTPAATYSADGQIIPTDPLPEGMYAVEAQLYGIPLPPAGKRYRIVVTIGDNWITSVRAERVVDDGWYPNEASMITVNGMHPMHQYCQLRVVYFVTDVATGDDVTASMLPMGVFQMNIAQRFSVIS